MARGFQPVPNLQIQPIQEHAADLIVTFTNGILMKSISSYLAVLFACCSPLSLYSQNSTARFMLWQPSARSIAMGGVGTAIVDNAFAVFYNPAGLGSNEISLLGSFAKPLPVLEHTIHSLTALSIPLRGLGVFGISASRFWRESQAVTLADSPELVGGDLEKSNFFKSTHWEIKLSYAGSISENISAGINLSYLRIKLSEVSLGPEGAAGVGKTSTALLGGGFLFKRILPQTTWKPELKQESDFLNKYADHRDDAGLSIGFAILNLGPQIAFADHARKDHPPTVASLGLAYWPISSPVISLSLSTDFEKEIFESSTLDYIHLGNEIRLWNLVSLRTGYFLDTYKSRTSYFTFGGGVHLRFLSLNVARYRRSLLPTWHFDATLSLEI